MNLVEQLKVFDNDDELERTYYKEHGYYFESLLGVSIFKAAYPGFIHEPRYKYLDMKCLAKELCGDGTYVEFTFEHEGKFYKATANNDSWASDGRIEFDGFNDLREVKPVQKMTTFYEEIKYGCYRTDS